jgi:hypothetical protein
MLYPIELWVQPRGIEKYEPWFDSASEYLGSPVVRKPGVNGALAGTGGVTNVTVNFGGAISPGGPGTIGTLTVSNAILMGNANMDINKATGTNDVLKQLRFRCSERLMFPISRGH